MRLRGAAIGAGATALLAVVIRFAYGPGAVGYDASFAMNWGSDLVHGRLPDFESPLAPTPHPLANLVSAPLSLIGDRAFDVIVLITIISLAALAWLAFRLGSKLFSPAVGVLFAAILVTRPTVANETLQALVDIPFLALVLGAGLLAAERRDPRLVLALLALAGLLRPEGWPLALAYAALVWRGDGAAHRAQIAALALAAPLLWALFDVIVTGDPLFSLHGTQDLAAELGRPRGARSALAGAPEYLRLLLGTPVAWLGMVGVLAGLYTLYDRALVPAAIAGLGLVGFVVLGVAGLPILTRYLFVPAVALALFAGVAVAGWTALPSDSPARRPWMVAGTLGGLLLLATLPSAVGDLRDVRRFIDGRREVQTDLLALVNSPTGAHAFKRCPVASVPDHRPLPLLAFWLGRPPQEIRNDVTYSKPGVAYASYTSESVSRRLLLEPTSAAPVPRTTPEGLRAVARNPSWVVYERC